VDPHVKGEHIKYLSFIKLLKAVNCSIHIFSPVLADPTFFSTLFDVTDA